MMGEHAVRLALRCYPAWWREKYADEVWVHATDMVADGYSPISLVQSLLWGAIRLRLSPQTMPKNYALRARRTSLCIAMAVVPLFIAVPIMELSTGGIQIDIGRTVPPDEAAGINDLNWIGLAMLVLLLVTIVVSVVGWVQLRSALRRTEASAKLRSLLWVPPFALTAHLALCMPNIQINQWTPMSAHTTAAHVMAAASPIVWWVGLVTSITCVLVVANRSQLQPSDLARGTRVATVTAVVLAGNLSAYCLRGGVLLREAHLAAHASHFWQSSSQQLLWVPTLLVLSLGVVVSVWASREARRSWRALATQSP